MPERCTDHDDDESRRYRRQPEHRGPPVDNRAVRSAPRTAKYHATSQTRARPGEPMTHGLTRFEFAALRVIREREGQKCGCGQVRSRGRPADKLPPGATCRRRGGLLCVISGSSRRLALEVLCWSRNHGAQTFLIASPNSIILPGYAHGDSVAWVGRQERSARRTLYDTRLSGRCDDVQQ
jgi:hypothetical protein